MLTCSECDRKVMARGLCRMHYYKAQRRGLLPDLPDQRSLPVSVRLSRKTAIQEDGCWLFTGAKSSFGYGVIIDGGRQKLTHRVSYQLHCGAIPEGALVCHTCDVRHCVNPAHLFIGTHDDNNKDKVDKGRQPHGSAIVNSKLSEQDARDILRNVSETHTAIAKRYGVAQSTVSRIKSGRRWKYL